MTNFKNEICELNIDDLDTVSGGMPFYGTGCSVNQNNGIGRVVDPWAAAAASASLEESPPTSEDCTASTNS